MPIKDKIRPVIFDLVGELVRHGHEAYIVGGAVRDLLLGLDPKDYDLATSASPQEVRNAFGRRRSRIIGKRFRLVHVYADHDIFEVSTFRRQPTAEERRERLGDDGVMIWRDNEFGTLEQDAERRDFTVNALYYDPVGDRGIIDYVGGVDDLNAGVVRAIGDPDARLAEDPVRILRALKLVGQHGFRLEPGLADAIAARNEQIQTASSTRLFEELLKITACPKALPILTAFAEHGFLRHYIPTCHRIWSLPTGTLMRSLLEKRDAKVATGTYSTSKALALATICLAYVIDEIGESSPGEMCGHQPGREGISRDAILRFFHPLPVPRFFSSRVRDILLLLPRMKSGSRVARICRHPEYRYGRELYSLFGEACGWDGEFMAPWPKAHPHHPAGGSRRRRSRRRRGPPRQQQDRG